jgi:membrane associated rhomboid family serine protease
MIPLKDENPTIRFPYITIAIIIANAVIFIMQTTMSIRGDFIFTHRFGAIPIYLTHLHDPFPADWLPIWLTPFTSLFLHGGFMHIIINMLFLWTFGNNVEDVLGHVRFLVFYLLCGLAATLAFVLTEFNSTTPLIGASGAIAGVMGAYLHLFPRARVLTLILIVIYPLFIWVPAVFFLIFWFVLQLINASVATGSPVAWAAHVGGFLAGLFGIRVFLRKRAAQPQYLH